jgi:hypothetical protein
MGRVAERLVFEDQNSLPFDGLDPSYIVRFQEQIGT